MIEKVGVRVEKGGWDGSRGVEKGEGEHSDGS